MPDEPLLPLWYRTLEKVAAKLATGCIVSGGFLKASQSYIPKDLFDLLMVLLIPFGIVCIVLSGGRAIDKIKNVRLKVDNTKK